MAGEAYSNADSLEFGLSVRRDGSWWGAAVAESLGQSHAGGLDIVVGDTERSGSEADLLDEVGDLGVVQAHVLVHLVHAGVALVWRHVLHAVVAAAEQVGEVLVQVGKETAVASQLGAFSSEMMKVNVLLSRVHAVGWHVVHQWSSTSTVQEVDRHSGVAASVGAGKTAAEVWQEVDLLAVHLTRSQDTWDLDANVWHGVVSNDGGVDEQGQERLLGRRIALLEERLGVVVTDGRIRRTLGSRH